MRRMSSMNDRRARAAGDPRREAGASLVEFALVLPILLMVLLGIVEFGLYFYNDLQLAHVARDAARWASVGDATQANAAIDNATLVSTDITARAVNTASTGQEASVILTAQYHTLTPLPQLVGLTQDLPIDATARMRRE